MNKSTLSEEIRNLADSTGIDALGFTGVSEFSDYALSTSPRRNPKLSLPDAKSIIVAGIYIGGLTLPEWTNPLYGRTSRLYLSGFFFDVVKPLEPIVQLLKKTGYRAIICESSNVDGSILPLKLAAKRAGLGWQGKHSLLISRKYGTFLALGGIITNADLEYKTRQEPDYCQKCDKCRQACPVEALNKPYVLDRNRCLSSLLQNEDLPGDAQSVLENRVIDCEICQQACPWNKKHLDQPLATHMTKLFQRKIEGWKKFFYLPDLVNLSEKKYREKTAHLNTGIPYNLFHRNVLIAMESAKKSRRDG
ncbi:epoxyqueuosine reductase [Thermodesulfobacteriota bacterium]